MTAPAPPDGERRADLLAVAAALGPLARVDHPLGRLTTYRVGGPAAVFCEAGDERALLAVRRALAGHRVPVLVLGKGSNLLVADAGFPGLVVRLTGSFAEITLPASDGSLGEQVVRAGARWGCRSWRGAPSRPGSPDWSGRSACRAASGERSA